MSALPSPALARAEAERNELVRLLVELALEDEIESAIAEYRDPDCVAECEDFDSRQLADRLQGALDYQRRQVAKWAQS